LVAAEERVEVLELATAQVAQVVEAHTLTQLLDLGRLAKALTAEQAELTLTLVAAVELVQSEVMLLAHPVLEEMVELA
jgi:DNA-binding TFAR19-related protein (PDSD5 family)